MLLQSLRNPGLILGETSSTAYYGDKGKTAYDHSQIVTGNPHSLTLGDLGGISHSLATAANDFLVASGNGVFAKQTLAEVKTTLGLASTYLVLAGGTMSGAITLANLANALNSGAYSLQMKSGATGATPGYIFDTTNNLLDTAGDVLFDLKNAGASKIKIQNTGGAVQTIFTDNAVILGELQTSDFNSYGDGLYTEIDFAADDIYLAAPTSAGTFDFWSGSLNPFKIGMSGSDSYITLKGTPVFKSTTSLNAFKFIDGSSNIFQITPITGRFEMSAGLLIFANAGGAIMYVDDGVAGGVRNFSPLNPGQSNDLNLGKTTRVFKNLYLGSNLFFGTSQSASMYYDGTDLIINPKLVETGTLKMAGNISMNANNFVLDTTTGTKIGTVGGASGQKLSVLGAPPITQQLLATGAGKTVDDVITVLQNFGIARQT